MKNDFSAFHKTWIYGLLIFMASCSGCAMFGDDHVCPPGLLKKVEYESDNGDRVIKSVSCYPEEGQRP